MSYGNNSYLVNSGIVDKNGYLPGNEPVGYNADATYAAQQKMDAEIAARMAQNAQGAAPYNPQGFSGSTVGAGMGQQPQFQGGGQTQPYGGYLGGAGQGGGMSAAVMPGTGPLMGTGGQWGTSAGQGGYNSSGSSNPYLSGAEAGITRRMTDNLNRNIMPQISQGAQSVGGYGGSRQGVVEANAMKDMNLGLGDSLAAMNSGDWNQQQGRNLSQYGMDQNFYTSQRGQDLASVGMGADLYSRGMSGQWDALTKAGQIYNPLITGMGTTTNNQSSGGGVQGAIGGAMGAYDFYKNLTK